MTNEVPSPEREVLPAERLFNLEAMSDEQILVAYRGFGMIAHEGNDEADPFDQMQVGDSLSDQFVAEVRDLAVRDPERVRRIVGRSVMSSNDIDHELGAHAASHLIEYDYKFARDVLIHLCVTGDDTHIAFPRDVARHEIYDLVRNRLTPDQADDFRTRMASHGLAYLIE